MSKWRNSQGQVGLGGYSNYNVKVVGEMASHFCSTVSRSARFGDLFLQGEEIQTPQKAMKLAADAHSKCYDL